MAGSEHETQTDSERDTVRQNNTKKWSEHGTDWMLQVTWLVLSIKNTLFQCGVSQILLLGSGPGVEVLNNSKHIVSY